MITGIPRAAISWSSGKDSAIAFYRIRMSGKFEVSCLLTTITDQFRRVSMHGVREELLDLQAESVGVPLAKLRIPYPCPNSVYEQKMHHLLSELKTGGVTHCVFGDLFLQDIRRYREEKLAQIGIQPVFPVWGENTSELAHEMISEGFRAVVTCVDTRKLDASFAGRDFDRSFLDDLPRNVDPCGENGEFHTFVYDGPVFRERIEVEIGERVLREGYQFVDVLAKTGTDKLSPSTTVEI
jgi:uncharacterized protein (TIGR00290 family)